MKKGISARKLYRMTNQELARIALMGNFFSVLGNHLHNYKALQRIID